MKLKNFLSKALIASAVAATLVAVSSVSAFAATAYDTGNVTVSETGDTKTWNFLENRPASPTNLADGDSIQGIVVYNRNANSNKIISHKSNNTDGLTFNGADMGFSIPVPKNCEGTVNFVFQTRKSDRLIDIEGLTAVGIETSSKGGNTFNFNSTHTEDGDIDVNFTLKSGGSDGDRKVQKITVTITKGEKFPIPVNYTLSGTCTGLSSGDKFTLTDGTHTYEVTADGNGNYSASSQKEAYADGKYTASLKNYNITYADGADGVTITSDGTSATVAPAINFEKLELQPLEAGIYDTDKVFGGMPYFNSSELSQSGKINNKEYIEFKVNEGAKVTVYWYCGSTNSSNSAKPSIRKGTSTVMSAPESQSGGNGLPVLHFTAKNLEADTVYNIYSDSSGTSTRIQQVIVEYSDKISDGATDVAGSQLSYAIDTTNNATYIIYGLTDEDLKKDTLTLKLGTQNDVTTEVYKTIEFAEGDTITAGEGDYAAYAALYAVKINNYAQAIPAGKVTAQLS